MPGTAIGKTLDIGFAGTVSRNPHPIITARALRGAPVVFGQAMALNPDNTYSAFEDTGDMDMFVGIVARQIRQPALFRDQTHIQFDEGDSVPVLSHGAVTVVCQNGTPTAGGPAYIRIALNAAFPNAVVGGFEAAADGANTLEAPNARWTTGYKDSNNVAELTLLTRANP